MPNASTSAADLPPASPSASSAAPWAACLPHRRNPRARVPTRAAITPASRRVNSSRTPAHVRQPAGKHHLARMRHRDGECRHRLYRALDVRVPCKATAGARQGRERLGRRGGRAGDRRDASAEQQALRDGAGEKRDFTVERARSAHAQRLRKFPRRRRRLLPSRTAIAAVNAPPSSSRMNETSRSRHPRRSACSRTASAAAHTLSAVPMSTRFTFRCAGTEGR